MTLLHVEHFYMAIAVIVFIMALLVRGILEFEVDCTVFPPRIHISFKRGEQKKTTKSPNKPPALKTPSSLQNAKQRQEGTLKGKRE